MKPVLFCCPVTGKMVQHLVADQAGAANQHDYDWIRCAACSNQHFVDRMGKVFGENRKENK